MKWYDVHVTKRAITDMMEIGRYITDELLEPAAAENLLNKLETAINSLETMPLKYPLVSDRHLSDKGIRKLPVDNNLVFYTVSEINNRVNIIRVLYQKRNWINLL